jgi:hypothetical protein
MQLGSSKDSFPCFTRLNPCIAHCSTDSISWIHHSREEGSLNYDRGFVRLQIHMKFNTNIHRQLNFMHKGPPSWTRGWHHQNGASGGAKCIITWGPTGAKGRSSRVGMGLGRSAQAGRPGPVSGSVRPPFSCTRRIFNPKVLEAPPFMKQRAIRTERPSTS